MLGSSAVAAGSGGHHGGGHSGNSGHGAHHHGSGARFVFFAGPVFPFGYYYPPYYYYPPPVYFTPAMPPYYIEQMQPSSQGYWYYCQATGTYYPYVQTCASGWQRMLPQSTPN
jgi:hypothetical protein